MTIEDLIQLMRTCSLAEIRTQLEKARDHDQAFYEKLVTMYQRAANKTNPK